MTAALVLLALVGFVPALPAADAPDWAAVSQAVVARLREAAKAYDAGDRERAFALATEAYFDVFEDRGMEIAMRRQISVQRVRARERRFGAIRDAIEDGASSAAIRREIDTLERELRGDARELTRLGAGRRP